MVRKEGGSLDDKVLIFIQIHRISGSGHHFFVLWWVSLTFSHIQWCCQIHNLPFSVMHWERAFLLKVRFCWKILNLRDPLMMQIFFSHLLWLPWSIMCVYFQPGHVMSLYIITFGWQENFGQRWFSLMIYKPYYHDCNWYKLLSPNSLSCSN